MSNGTKDKNAKGNNAKGNDLNGNQANVANATANTIEGSDKTAGTTITKTKERDYMFDTFRGLLMWSIPLSHFTRVAGDFSQTSLSGVIYITINVFVMQAFVFLSGFFSKKPERSKETSFQTFMWPYLLGIPFFYMVRFLIFGKANWNLDEPPFALWYLWSLFFYRYFTKEWLKIPHVLSFSLVLYIFAGQIPFLTGTLGLGRTVSYFPFFVMAFYCTSDQIKKLRCLKGWQTALLGLVLTGCSFGLAYGVPQLPVGFYLLKTTAKYAGTTWYWDIIGRIMVLFLAWGWMIFMFNILSSKKNYLAYVGTHTMPVYILHLIVRYLVGEHGIGFGILPTENKVVYYLAIFGLASLCTIVFSSKPVDFIYNFVVNGLYKVFIWLGTQFFKLVGLLNGPLMAIKDAVLHFVEAQGGGATRAESEAQKAEKEA